MDVLQHYATDLVNDLMAPLIEDMIDDAIAEGVFDDLIASDLGNQRVGHRRPNIDDYDHDLEPEWELGADVLDEENA